MDGLPLLYCSVLRAEPGVRAARLLEEFRAAGEFEIVSDDPGGAPPGKDLLEVIARCRAVVVVIGPHRPVQDGPGEVVLRGLEATRLSGARVVPVLVDGAPMPTVEELPDELAWLASRRAFELRDTHWRADVRTLLDLLAEASEGASAARAAPVRTSLQTGIPLPELLALGARLSVEDALHLLTQIAIELDAAAAVGRVPTDVRLAYVRVVSGGTPPRLQFTGLEDEGNDGPAVDVRAAFRALAGEMLQAAGCVPLEVDAIGDPAASCSELAGMLPDAIAAARVGAEDVQFTVVRPGTVEPERWCTLLAFAHLSSGAQAPGAPDPLEEVARQVDAALGREAAGYATLTQDSAAALVRASEITFQLRLPGVDVNPAARTFRWLEDVHREEFRLRAPASLDGSTVRGALTVWLGPVVLAEIPVTLRINVAGPPPAPIRQSPARRIFASYSHADAKIVEDVERVCVGLGEEFLRDATRLRSGERWEQRIAEMIEEADLFQLFWSSNAMRSQYVRQEWEYALGLRRAGFIRPTYWETPLPSDGDELPPLALRELHFSLLPMAAPVTEVEEAPRPSPPLAAPRPRRVAREPASIPPPPAPASPARTGSIARARSPFGRGHGVVNKIGLGLGALGVLAVALVIGGPFMGRNQNSGVAATTVITSGTTPEYTITTPIDPTQSGEEIYAGRRQSESQTCGSCHTDGAAPKLDDVTLNLDFTIARGEGRTGADDVGGFIRESIVDPDAYLPQGYRAGSMPRAKLSAGQVDALERYIEGCMALSAQGCP